MKYVFVHGLMQKANAWDIVIERLDFKDEIICPSLSFNSENGTFAETYNNFAEEFNGLPDSINLCGLSLGGLIAIKYTIENPEKVNSLVLIGTQYKMPELLMKIQNLFFHLIPKKVFLKQGFDKKQIMNITKSMYKIDFAKELKSINCPIKIICGLKDKANLKAAKELNKLIKNSSLTLMEQTGHAVNEEKPVELAEILTRFYKELKF
ncbi:alpha/beta fold hydrolase [Treponema phagedenis]|uniref:Alpha/beta fold hydrolase n=1 Tax=Treponema phagedenis TaxID=162 RepID=A0A0B7H0I2_TREPH|nr:alpha/beta hydrolase [Treponema phagedenis]NVP22882.1 alpha/beta fold hydrolase [Treponema phagedenis]QEJ94956.1 alpha/beta fold hydrolase [Treponema phagedenis]QEJ98315.1 alpha/beta fold hydrolase [Treponema phagedenis]QEK00859.1 alpha/beta fold hydrolase [Treponema phagedenis]QEK03825.1 alpha/beta fold hydrolase [Treponema phagedenis]